MVPFETGVSLHGVDGGRVPKLAVRRGGVLAVVGRRAGLPPAGAPSTHEEREDQTTDEDRQ